MSYWTMIHLCQVTVDKYTLLIELFKTTGREADAGISMLPFETPANALGREWTSILYGEFDKKTRAIISFENCVFNSTQLRDLFYNYYRQ